MTKHRLVNLLAMLLKKNSISWSVGLAEDIFARAPQLVTEYGCKDIEGGSRKLSIGMRGDHFME